MIIQLLYIINRQGLVIFLQQTEHFRIYIRKGIVHHKFTYGINLEI